MERQMGRTKSYRRKSMLTLIGLLSLVTAFNTYGAGPGDRDQRGGKDRGKQQEPVRGKQNDRRDERSQGKQNDQRNDRFQGRQSDRREERPRVQPRRGNGHYLPPTVKPRLGRQQVRDDRRRVFHSKHTRVIQRQNRMNHNHNPQRWQGRHQAWNNRYQSYRPIYPRQLFVGLVLGVSFPLYIEGRVWNYTQIEQATDSLEQLSMNLYEEALIRLGHSPYNNMVLASLYDVVEAAQALENKVNFNYYPSASLYELFYLKEMIEIAEPYFNNSLMDNRLSNKFKVLSYQVDDLHWHYRHSN